MRVDLPVIEAGGADILLTDAAGAPVAGAIVAFHRCTGGPAEHRVRSAFDGAALAELVRPGCWHLYVGDMKTGEVTVQAGTIASIRLRRATND